MFKSFEILCLYWANMWLQEPGSATVILSLCCGSISGDSAKRTTHLSHKKTLWLLRKGRDKPWDYLADNLGYISAVRDLGFGRLSMGDWRILIDSIGRDTVLDPNNKYSP